MKHTHRPRQTPEKIQSLVTQFHQSELSSTAFCKKYGLAYSSFYTWCKKYPVAARASVNRSSPPTQFIDLQAMAAPHHGAWNGAVPHSRIHRFNYYFWMSSSLRGISKENFFRTKLQLIGRQLQQGTFPNYVLLSKGIGLPQGGRS